MTEEIPIGSSMSNLQKPKEGEPIVKLTLRIRHAKGSRRFLNRDENTWGSSAAHAPLINSAQFGRVIFYDIHSLDEHRKPA
mmetsp:Transcript_29746/g.72466  ORF Transcript_29746/g.72466 Transcript_29746/m.72466 type:complete len:81 (-) Transcript_29746:188-430(-)